MYNRIQKISSFLNKEDPDPSKYISEEIQQKYKIYKQWLIDNGAIFQKNIDFPYTYGPFHIIGCKCISDIKENEGILLVPRNLMIIAQDLHYLDKYLEKLGDGIFDEEDRSTLYLTLNLYLEHKNKKSFFKPYIDLIFTNLDYFSTWNDDNFAELENPHTVRSIKNLLFQIDELYKSVIKCEKFSKMTKNDFSYCYFQVVSRQFYLDADNSAMVPLADLLNHSSVKIHYEIYDSENMVFKYTVHFTDESDINIDVKPTFLKEIPIIRPTYNKLLPFKSNKDNYENDKYEFEGSESTSDDGIIVTLNKNDCFCISTSLKQSLKKNSQAFNNYCDINNKSLLKYYGFCLINNVYDYTNLLFYIDKDDKLLNKCFEIMFNRRYKNNISIQKNVLKLRIEYNCVCTNIIKYFRFMYFFQKLKNVKEYFLYKFDITLEICSINLSIDCLNNKLYMMEENSTCSEEVKDLEDEIYNNENPSLFNVNFLIYRIGQKINVLNQISLLNSLLKVMKKHKDNIKKYEDLYQYLNEFVNISEYDNEIDAKTKIIDFIEKMKKYKY